MVIIPSAFVRSEVCFQPCCNPCGWLGLKHELTKLGLVEVTWTSETAQNTQSGSTWTPVSFVTLLFLPLGPSGRVSFFARMCARTRAHTHISLPLRLYLSCSGKSESIGHSRNMDSLSKVLDSVIYETTNTAFLIFPVNSWSFCARTFQSHFWTRCTCVKDRNMQICEGHEANKSFSKVSWREHCICEAASQIDLQNQSAICQNVLCLRESMAESIDHAPAKPSPVKRRRFQRFKKVYHERWPFVMIDEEGDTCANSEVCSTVVIRLNWRTVEHDQQTAFSAARNW